MVAGRTAAYPGTFDPPTVAHLAVAEAAWRQGDLVRVDLVVSRNPLGKAPGVPSFEDRLTVLSEVAASRTWLGVRVTDRRLIAEVAAGYDAVIMGLDKWHQVVDPAWYGGSVAARDAAVAALPEVLLALRAGSPPPPSRPASMRVLEVHEDHLPVSSSLVRAGRSEWMVPEAARFDARTGAWTDPERYRRRSVLPGSTGSSGPAGSAPPAGTDRSAGTSLSPMPGRIDQPQQ